MCLQSDVRAWTLVQRRVPFLASVEGFALDHVRPVTEGDIGTVQVDGLTRPLALQSELVPGPEVALGPACRRGRPLRADPPAGALRAEDAINLL